MSNARAKTAALTEVSFRNAVYPDASRLGAEELLAELIPLGDALRVGVPLPHAAHEWLRSVSLPAVHAAAKSLCEDVRQTRIEGLTEEELSLEAVRRDGRASAGAALRRVALAQDLLPHEVSSLVELDECLGAYELQLTERLLLGEGRAASAVLGPSHAAGLDEYLSSIAERVLYPAAARPASEAALRWPDENTVSQYIDAAASMEAVIGAAREHSEFSRFLARRIDELIQTIGHVSWHARLWRGKVGYPCPIDPLGFRLPVRVAEAATRLEIGHDIRNERLGALSPLDAQARLKLEAHGATLFVYEGKDAIAKVELTYEVKEATLATRQGAGYWAAKIPVDPDAHETYVSLRVVAHDGREFFGPLHLVAGGGED